MAHSSIVDMTSIAGGQMKRALFFAAPSTMVGNLASKKTEGGGSNSRK
jgi:hypothetical protein